MAHPSTHRLSADNRPQATLRMRTQDHGPVLQHGAGPDDTDALGARDVWVFSDGQRWYMHYDAAGPRGWLSALATSRDGLTWEPHGTILDLGPPGHDDSASASYGTVFQDGDQWHLFYLGTPNATPAPDRIPAFPYLTRKAVAAQPTGPWVKQPGVKPLSTREGTYHSLSASPGQVIRWEDQYLMFFSASTLDSGRVQRTLGLARTRNLNGSWQPDPEPLLPLAEQIENASLYFEPETKLWFLFTNHVGLDAGASGLDTEGEYTDAVWVYWSADPEHWSPECKAVVLDSSVCQWSPRVIGLPSVVPIGGRLAVYYDGLSGPGLGHMRRDIGLAWLDLPLRVPTASHL